MFKSKLLAQYLALFALITGLGVQDSRADEPNEATVALAEIIADLNTFQADFEQRVKNEEGTEIDFSSGTFSIKRPNLFRWEIKKNFEQIIVADGKDLWTYDRDLEQVTIQNQVTLLTDSPLLFLTSNAKQLAESFKVSQVPVKEKPAHQLFVLKPVKKESVFDSVHILFVKGVLSELLMADSLGQQTTVKFSDSRLNKELDDKLFQFTIPEGVDVVDSRERSLSPD